MRDSSLYPFRFGIYFSFANTFVWMIATGTPMVLMAEYIGASPFHTGLLYASVFLFLPIQVLATTLLPRLGYKRQLILAWGVRIFFLLIPLGIALRAPESPGQGVLLLYIAAIFGFCFVRAFGACALLPWLFEILPENKRGKYFSMDSVVVGCGGIITLLFSSLIFNLLPPYPAFALLFAGAFVASGLGLKFVSKLPNGGQPVVTPLRSVFRRTPRLCSRPSYYRRFLKWQLWYGMVGYAFVPFTLYYMKSSLGFSQSYIFFLTALQFLGMSVAAYLIRDWIDRVGVKLIFTFSHLLTLSFQLFWLCMLLFPGVFEFMLPVVAIVVGAAMATFLTATNKYLPTICKKHERALSIAVLSSLVGFIGGVSVTLWGVVLKDDATGQIDPVAFKIYFLICILVQIFLLIGYCRMRDKTVGREAIPASGFMVRPFRYLTALVNLVEAPKKKSN